jgi:phosphopantetheinyl transferase
MMQYTGKASPKRSREWLAGRIAVKKSVQRLLSASGEPASQEKAVRVVQDPKGKPSAELTDRPGFRIGHVSLSHSNGLALAVVALPGVFKGLGVDVEKVEPRSESWVNDYFAPEEIRVANAADERWLEFTKIWCLKEAALKALGTGLRFDLKDVCVTSLDGTGRATVELRNEAGRYLDESGWGALDARVEDRDGLVVARVVIRN